MATAPDLAPTAPPASIRPGWPGVRQAARSFVPFGLGMVAALLAAELTPNLRLYRSIYTVWVAHALAIPALALFPHHARRPALYREWRLFWTYSLIAYLVHLGYSWYGVFGGQLALARAHPELYGVEPGATVLDLVLVHQGPFVAYSNLAVTALWALDVLRAWLLPGVRRGALGGLLMAVGVLAWLSVAVSFVTATLYFPKHTIGAVLGWLLIAAVVVSVLARLAVGGGAGSRDGTGAPD